MEVSLGAESKMPTERVVTVVDCDRVVSPATVEARVQGGTLFDLSATLFGNITIKGGRIEQSSFHDCHVLRMNETPVMETHILPSSEAPTGTGGISTVLITPALLNAVHDAIGQRIRELPLSLSSIGLA